MNYVNIAVHRPAGAAFAAPPDAPAYHQVRYGDTLRGVAARYHIAPATLLRDNGIEEGPETDLDCPDCMRDLHKSVLLISPAHSEPQAAAPRPARPGAAYGMPSFSLQRPDDEPTTASRSSRTSQRTSAPQDGLSNADYQAVAAELHVDVASLKAIAQVESSGRGFQADGKPLITYNAHVFDRETRGRFRDTCPTLSTKHCDRSLYGAPGQHQWDRMGAAAQLDPDAAAKSCAWGRFQLMGFNYRRCGFSSLREFTAAMQTPGGQLRAFANFIKSDPALRSALQNHQWSEAARRYNGPDYAGTNYDGKLQDAYARNAGTGQSGNAVA